MTPEALPFVLLVIAAAFTLGLTIGSSTAGAINVYVNTMEDNEQCEETEDGEDHETAGAMPSRPICCGPPTGARTSGKTSDEPSRP